MSDNSIVTTERTPLQLRHLELLRDRKNPKAVTEIMESMAPAIRKYAAKYARLSGMDAEDLESEGRIIILKAIDDFEEGKGCTFSTFAFPRLEFLLMKHTKEVCAEIRLPKNRWSEGIRPVETVSASKPISASNVEGNGSVTIEDLIKSEECSALDRLLAEESNELVRAALDMLPERHRAILIGRMNELTLEQIGTQLGGMSRERVRQIEVDAAQDFVNAYNGLTRGRSKKTPRRHGVGHQSLQPLRDYQERAASEIVDTLAQAKSTLFVCPTGGGKTHVIAEVAARSVASGRILILSDREHIVQQTKRRVRELTGLSVGVEQGELTASSENPTDVVCATIQSISRPERLQRFPSDAFGLVIIDEADLAVAPSYLKVLEHFSGAKVFGCTATPDRLDGQEISDVFTSKIKPVYLVDLIDQGYLSPIKRFLIAIESVMLTDVPCVSTGDFQESKLEAILSHEKPLHEVVVPTLKLAEKRPTLVFAVNVDHARKLSEVFNRYRPGCAVVAHGGTPLEARRALLRDLEGGVVQFVCSCGLYLRGIDLPFVSCIAMARPTKSPSLYCQAIGRGMRKHSGKDDLLVIDFTDNSKRYDLISIIDLLSPTSKEARHLANELLKDRPGADPISVLDEAESELVIDEDLANKVRAEVAFLATPVEPIDWSAQPLGKVSDVSIARRLNCSVTAVQRARMSRGIPAYANVIKPAVVIDWSKIPLGAMSDTTIFSLFGVEPEVTNRARLSFGERPTWAPAYLPGDRIFAPANNCQLIEWGSIPLGTMDDRLLASVLGVLHRHVTEQRLARGIAEHSVDMDSLPYGQQPDTVIGINNGLHPHTVRDARKRRKIASYYAIEVDPEVIRWRTRSQ